MYKGKFNCTVKRDGRPCSVTMTKYIVSPDELNKILSHLDSVNDDDPKINYLIASIKRTLVMYEPKYPNDPRDYETYSRSFILFPEDNILFEEICFSNR